MNKKIKQNDYNMNTKLKTLKHLSPKEYIIIKELLIKD